jgi:hypothetical protein
MELAGQTVADLGGLDANGVGARKLYFLRRSIATLHEFTKAIQELDKLPSFQPIKVGFDSAARVHWSRAVVYFKKHDSYIARLRNNVGGHFAKPSAKEAISHLLPDATGSLEVIFTSDGGGAKLSAII